MHFINEKKILHFEVTKVSHRRRSSIRRDENGCCPICKKRISSSNWARHARIHYLAGSNSEFNEMTSKTFEESTELKDQQGMMNLLSIEHSEYILNSEKLQYGDIQIPTQIQTEEFEAETSSSLTLETLAKPARKLII